MRNLLRLFKTFSFSEGGDGIIAPRPGGSQPVGAWSGPVDDRAFVPEFDERHACPSGPARRKKEPAP